MTDHLTTIQLAVIGGKRMEIQGLVQRALDAGVDPNVIVNEALIAAMDVVGKNLVTMMLEGAGFKVFDLGVDLSVEKLIDQFKAPESREMRHT